MKLTPGIYGNFNFSIGKNNIVLGNKNIVSGEQNILDHSNENIISGENILIKNSHNNITSGTNISLKNNTESVVIGNFDKYSNYDKLILTSSESLVFLNSKGSYLENINFEKSFVNLYFNNFGNEPFDDLNFKNSIVNEELTQYVDFSENDVLDTDLLFDTNFPFTFSMTLVKELYGTQDYEELGSSIAFDDNYIYVGIDRASGEEIGFNGKVMIFDKSDYSVVHELYGSQEGENFGCSIAVDDNYLYVGSPYSNSNELTSNGQISIINKSDYTTVHELYGSQDGENFGSSVAVDDNYIYAGGYLFDNGGLTDNGRIVIFDKSDYSIIHELYGTQNREIFGSSVAVDDNHIYVGSSGFDSNDLENIGKLTIFNKSDYNIVHELYGTQESENFGHSVAVDDNYIYVGSPYFDSDGLNANGKIAIFNKFNYSLVKELHGTQENSYFGYSVGVKNNYFGVGCYYFSSNGKTNNGKVSIFKIS